MLKTGVYSPKTGQSGAAIYFPRQARLIFGKDPCQGEQEERVLQAALPALQDSVNNQMVRSLCSTSLCVQMLLRIPF